MSALKFKASFDCYDALCVAYSEKHRFYHTVKHIEAMLGHYDAVKDLAERPAELVNFCQARDRFSLPSPRLDPSPINA